MTLPSSGTISMSQIRTELGITGDPTGTNFSLSYATIGGYAPINVWSNPKPTTVASLAAWHGYNHLATAPNIVNFQIFGNGLPEYGMFDAYWGYTTGTYYTVEWTYLDYSFNYGSSWTQLVSFYDTYTTSYSNQLEGYQGFTSLDNTYFRLRAYAGGNQVPNSPIYAYPPFPY